MKPIRVTIKVANVIAGTFDSKTTEVTAVTRWCETVEELLNFAQKYGVTLAWHEARSALDSGDCLIIDCKAKDAEDMEAFWQYVGASSQ